MPTAGTNGTSSKPYTAIFRTLRHWLYAFWRWFDANSLIIIGLFLMLTASIKDHIMIVAGVNALAFGLGDLINRRGGDRSLSRALQIVGWMSFALLIYLIYRSWSS
jgi:hypothetical protein